MNEQAHVRFSRTMGRTIVIEYFAFNYCIVLVVQQQKNTSCQALSSGVEMGDL